MIQAAEAFDKHPDSRIFRAFIPGNAGERKSGAAPPRLSGAYRDNNTPINEGFLE